MTQPDHSEAIGIVGGTGPLGRGLAVRWALAGYDIWVGSRTEDKAADVADRIRAQAGEDVSVRGADNLRATQEADIVVVTVPYEAQASTLPDLREAVGDKLVVNVVNPMVFDDVGPKAVPVEEGSAGQQCQALLPEARVVSAFHDVAAARLWEVGHPVDCDVLVCGDDEEATHRVAHLAAEIPGMWGVNCGPLRNSVHIENMTPVLLFINRYYGIKAGLRIEGIERREESMHAHRRTPDEAG